MNEVAPARGSFIGRSSNAVTGFARCLRSASGKRDLKFWFGATVVSVMILAALLAPVIATHDPVAIDDTPGLLSPRPSNLLGTDQLGRDEFSRVVHGARVSLLVGMGSVGLALVVGTTLGMIAGYFGGLIDEAIMRLADVFFAFPAIILALVIISILGTSTLNLIIAIATFTAPGLARVARSSTLVVREELYTDAERAVGASTFRILRQTIFPNITAPLIVIATLQIPGAIIAEAGLSFLGLGTPLPAATWGAMLSDSRIYVHSAPWLILAPGIAIMLTVMGFVMLGDSLRDILDPRTHTRGSE